MKKINPETPEEIVNEIDDLTSIFNSADAEKQWQFLPLITEDEGVELLLSEEYTDLLLSDEDGNEVTLRMKEAIGCHKGLTHLLNLLNLKHKFV